MNPLIIPKSSLNDSGQLPKSWKNMISGTPGVAHFLNVLDAVSTVGGENSTEQSSNILSNESLEHAWAIPEPFGATSKKVKKSSPKWHRGICAIRVWSTLENKPSKDDKIKRYDFWHLRASKCYQFFKSCGDRWRWKFHRSELKYTINESPNHP